MEDLAGSVAKLSASDPPTAAAAATPQVLEQVKFDGIIQYIKDGKCKNIITMAGAGISTAAGIPDFRSPGTGLYHNLQKFKLPQPEAIFDIGFFKDNPRPFSVVAKELFPGNFSPTICHHFIRLLHEKGLLLRHYTQNIDMLERLAGIPAVKVVEAHGTFFTSHCLKCSKEFSLEWIKERIFSDVAPRCDADGCEGLVKPDIVFFGEALPKVFFDQMKEDFPLCDLLIIMGTSLTVQPFASLVNKVPETTHRLLINKEKVKTGRTAFEMLMSPRFDFNSSTEHRDVFWQGSCDDGCMELARRLGWEKELKTDPAGATKSTAVTKIPEAASGATVTKTPGQAPTVTTIPGATKTTTVTEATGATSTTGNAKKSTAPKAVAQAKRTAIRKTAAKPTKAGATSDAKVSTATTKSS